MGDLFGTTPDSIPLFWQWLALIVGILGTVLGISLGGLALFMMMGSQPNLVISFEAHRQDDLARLEIAPYNEPRKNPLGRMLRVRRIPTNAMVLYSVRDMKTNAIVGGGMVEDTLYSPTRYYRGIPIITMVQLSGRIATTMDGLKDGGRKPIPIPPGTYILEAIVMEEEYTKVHKRSFLVGTSLDVLKWL